MEKIFVGSELLFNDTFLVMKDMGSFWFATGTGNIEDLETIQISEDTAQKVAIVILQKLGHRVIVLDDYDESGNLK